MAAEAQLRVAQLALLAGDSAEAIAAAEAAAAAFSQQTRTAWRARAQLVKAEARLSSGTATPADLSEARAAASRMADAGATSPAVQGLLVTGRLAAALGLRRQAITALTHAAALACGAPVLVQASRPGGVRPRRPAASPRPRNAGPLRARSYRPGSPSPQPPFS